MTATLPSPSAGGAPLAIERTAHGVVRVVLQRPEVLNAFDETLIAALQHTFAALGADPAVRAIVLAAAGRTFCAGADVAWMRRAAARDEAGNLADAQRFAAMMDTLARCPKPVVARVQGGAFGGGVGLVCAADIVIASGDATFSVSEARLGILPAVIGPYLVNAVGPRQARRLALTAERLDARQALAMGLVTQVCDHDALDAAVQNCVQTLLRSGPCAQAEVKRLFDTLACGPVSEGVRLHTAQTIARVRTSDEAREGFAAFVAKRPAAWVPQDRSAGSAP